MNEASVAELNANLDGSTVLDVRETFEYEAGHVPGALSIPLALLPIRAIDIPRDRPVYVICEVGGRSAHASMWLEHNGLPATNVYGGMYEWRASGLPVVTGVAP